MHASARAALAAAFVSLGGLSSVALAQDTHSGVKPDMNDPTSRATSTTASAAAPIRSATTTGRTKSAQGNRVLIYTRTAGPRHANLGPAPGRRALNPPLHAGNATWCRTRCIRWLAAEGIEADWTEDVTRITSLHRYKAVIFASTSRDTLCAHGRAIDPTLAVNTSTNAHLDAAKTALRQYMRAGGGFVGIHNAFGTEYNWPYYEGLLGNANYYDHGANQNGDGGDRREGQLDGRPAGALAVPGRVVQPAAVPDQGEVPRQRRREHARHAARDPSGARQVPPGRLVPVLRRRPRLGDHARPRRRGVHRRLGLPRPGAVPEA